MFLILPDALPRGRRFLDRRRQLHPRRTSPSLGQPQIVAAFWISIRISAASALLGAVIGLAIALAIIRGRLPVAAIRSTVMTFSGVASNFAGVPLAFAFLATLGRLGLVTILLKAVRLRPLSRRLQPPELLGPRPSPTSTSRSR